jgi:hypothetical protein
MSPRVPPDERHGIDHDLVDPARSASTTMAPIVAEPMTAAFEGEVLVLLLGAS